MDTTVRIRPIESAQLATLIRIGDETGLSAWSAADYLEESKDSNSIMLRLDSDEFGTIGFVVGRVVLAADDENAVDAEIFNIAVESHLQRQGFGQTLLDSFMAEARRRNVRKIWLEVRSSNASAIAFYEVNGFQRMYLRASFYSSPREDGIVMARSL